MSILGITTQPKQILYQKNKEFIIVPTMTKQNTIEFDNFVKTLKNKYQSTSICNGKKIADCFFWDFNKTNNSIIINETTNITENDIFNQLTTLIFWLFDKNYLLKGSFLFKTGNIIEYIATDGITKFITHYVLTDEINIDKFNIEYTADINAAVIQDKIMLDAEYNLKNAIRMREAKDEYKLQKYIKNIENGNKKKIIRNKYDPVQKETVWYTVNPNESINEENKLVINAIQERLTKTENNLKSLSKINKFFWKMCTIVSIITAGTLVIYIAFNNDIN